MKAWSQVGGVCVNVEVSDMTLLRCSGLKSLCTPCKPELELQDSLRDSGAWHRWHTHRQRSTGYQVEELNSDIAHLLRSCMMWGRSLNTCESASPHVWNEISENAMEQGWEAPWRMLSVLPCFLPQSRSIVNWGYYNSWLECHKWLWYFVKSLNESPLIYILSHICFI